MQWAAVVRSAEYCTLRGSRICVGGLRTASRRVHYVCCPRSSNTLHFTFRPHLRLLSDSHTSPLAIGSAKTCQDRRDSIAVGCGVQHRRSHTFEHDIQCVRCGAFAAREPWAPPQPVPAGTGVETSSEELRVSRRLICGRGPGGSCVEADVGSGSVTSDKLCESGAPLAARSRKSGHATYWPRDLKHVIDITCDVAAAR